MKLVDLATIENVREYFLEKGYPQFTVELGGERFKYFEVSQSEEPRLPKFATMLTTGKEQDGYLAGVADTVDKKFQPYWMFHEFYEAFRTQNLEITEQCPTSLKRELILVPKEIKKDYILQRREFFEKLVPYAINNNYPQREIYGFGKSYDHLDRIVRKLGLEQKQLSQMQE
ncbi:MAG: hypothetical protein KKF46_05285 [Nanoarchaeota archaeon]|nr:hypothetical protein [Nanoarchaeota archaeon]MBU1321747.1 hypothetical protein [Nanoarchaeota archaeon]MBU1597471.1 hypothetical protein [Nanoarchaeota archaeon]MBU2441409.1 hypothetical protein [Nanoarchaeota archaeon]